MICPPGSASVCLSRCEDHASGLHSHPPRRQRGSLVAAHWLACQPAAISRLRQEERGGPGSQWQGGLLPARHRAGSGLADMHPVRARLEGLRRLASREREAKRDAAGPRGLEHEHDAPSRRPPRRPRAGPSSRTRARCAHRRAPRERLGKTTATSSPASVATLPVGPAGSGPTGGAVARAAAAAAEATAARPNSTAERPRG